jgi:autotransporter-associated beta strand protein
LTLTADNTYKGATVVHDGTLEFSSLKNGGVASSIGASVEYAQNWIFDGGTYRYTGPTTTTNRSLKLSSTSTFDVKSATVTMNGVVEGADASSSFIIDGGGQLTVGTTKFFGYKGATILKGAALYLSTTDIAKAGIGSAKIYVNGYNLLTLFSDLAKIDIDPEGLTGGAGASAYSYPNNRIYNFGINLNF